MEGQEKTITTPAPALIDPAPNIMAVHRCVHPYTYSGTISLNDRSGSNPFSNGSGINPQQRKLEFLSTASKSRSSRRDITEEGV